MGAGTSTLHPSAITQKEREAVLGCMDDEEPSLEQVARLIRDGKVSNVVFLCGAGISVSAGIPDFRTPGTGLYDNLQKYNLPRPEAVFSIDFFKENPEPFYLLSKEIMPQPEKYRPTPTHFFMKLLEDEGILRRVYTQNIDCLERVCGIAAEKLVECHGTYARAACIGCRRAVPIDVVRDGIRKEEVVRCEACDSLVKPDITFFGENLPPRFAEMKGPDEKAADLLVVMGTSLAVYPVAGLADTVSHLCPRMLINMEAVHALGGESEGKPLGKDERGVAICNPAFRFGLKDNYRDVLVQGGCDEGVRKLCELIGRGYPEKLQALIDAFDPSEGAQRVERVEAQKAKKEKEKVKEKVKEEKRQGQDDAYEAGAKEKEGKENETGAARAAQKKGEVHGIEETEKQFSATAGCSELTEAEDTAVAAPRAAAKEARGTEAKPMTTIEIGVVGGGGDGGGGGEFMDQDGGKYFSVAPLYTCEHVEGGALDADTLRDQTADELTSWMEEILVCQPCKVQGGSSLAEEGGADAAAAEATAALSTANELRLQCMHPSCKEEKEIWLCAHSECRGKVAFCGRAVKGHMLEHHKQTGHAVAIGLLDLSVWCFKCDSYIRAYHNKARGVYGCCHKAKFGTLPPV